VLATLRFVDFGDPPAVAAQVGNATFTPANGGDAGPYASRYGGAAEYPTALATVDTLTVFHPQSFRAFASPLASSVFIDPKSGKQDFVSGCLRARIGDGRQRDHRRHRLKDPPSLTEGLDPVGDWARCAPGALYRGVRYPGR
jgi:hypothetical protein